MEEEKKDKFKYIECSDIVKSLKDGQISVVVRDYMEYCWVNVVRPISNNELRDIIGTLELKIRQAKSSVKSMEDESEGLVKLLNVAKENSENK